MELPTLKKLILKPKLAAPVPAKRYWSAKAHSSWSNTASYVLLGEHGLLFLHISEKHWNFPTIWNSILKALNLASEMLSECRGILTSLEVLLIFLPVSRWAVNHVLTKHSPPILTIRQKTVLYEHIHEGYTELFVQKRSFNHLTEIPVRKGFFLSHIHNNKCLKAYINAWKVKITPPTRFFVYSAK